MNLIVVYDLPENIEDPALTLSDVIGITKYEAWSRIRFVCNVPVVISGYADSLKAGNILDKLISMGYGAIMIKREDIETENDRFIVRKISLGEGSFDVESRKDRMTVIYSDIYLMIRGTSIERSSETIKERKRKFSAGRAMMTAGLASTKIEEKKHEEVDERREGFVNLYSTGGEIIECRENSVDYLSMGTGIRYSRIENFLSLISGIRQRCSNALFNSSLLNRPAQVQLLGPLFEPEKDLDIAISVMVNSIRKTGSNWPLT